MTKSRIILILLLILMIPGCGGKSQPGLIEMDDYVGIDYKKNDVIDITVEKQDIKSFYFEPRGYIDFISTNDQGNLFLMKYDIADGKREEVINLEGSYFLGYSASEGFIQTILTASDDEYILDIYPGLDRHHVIRILRDSIKSEYPFFACCDGINNCILLTRSSIIMIDSSGKILKEKEYDGISFFQAERLSDGTIMAIYTGKDRIRYLAIIEAETMKLIGEVQIDFYPTIICEKEGKCMLSDGKKLFFYDVVNGAVKKYYDLDKYYFKSECVRFLSFSNKKMYLIYQDAQISKSLVKVFEFEESDKSDDGSTSQNNLYDTEGRRIIRIYSATGTEYARSCFGEALTEFNLDNKDFAVDVIPEEADIDIALDSKLNPDIICSLNPGIITKYGKKGYLEDLWLYIDQSEDIKRGDINESVKKLYEIDGHLYGITDEISVKGIRVSDVGGEFDGSWTVEEFVEWLADHNDVKTSSGIDNAYVFYLCLNGLMNDNVNFERGEANFINKRFLDIIKSIAALPLEKTTGSVNLYASSMIDEARMHPYLTSGTVGSIEAMAREDTILGKKLEYVGYPSDSNVAKGILSPLSNVAITVNSDCKEGAYAFIEYWLKHQERELDNIESKYNFSRQRGTFYSINDVFEDTLKAGLGKRAIIINSSQGDEIRIEFDVTSDYIDSAKRMLETAVAESYEQSCVKEIMSEELQYFLNGVCDAETTAQKIQNRVQLFLDETE